MVNVTTGGRMRRQKVMCQKTLLVHIVNIKHLVIKSDTIQQIFQFLGSSVVEQMTVNHRVAGSNPARGARPVPSSS